jgi:hypothetical protein
VAKTGLNWLDAIKALGNFFLSEGRELAARKRSLEAELVEVRRKEIALWVKIAESGHWTQTETTKAMMEMDPDLLSYLPDRFPRPPAARRRRTKPGTCDKSSEKDGTT